jgi:biotin synthase-like enzyme
MIRQADGRNLAQDAQSNADPVHPLGSKAKVLLTSVFGPYALDNEYSRAVNPMELYHNQVTREQGPFSLRMFHRSWGIMLIQSNIQAPCSLLDFPVYDRFVSEIRDNEYDIIGITGITPNVAKVAKMCELIREHRPEATIVVGGHIANMPDLGELVDADIIVKGEGIRWFRSYLGEDTEQPIRHPIITSGFGTRNVGLDVKEVPQDVAATLIPSVGCPLGCNFCSTSAMFGGKGKFVNFYETGDELFDVMCQIEEELGISSFFVMDENFLLHRKRALRLLELMEENNKAWALFVFSSANALRKYTIDQLISLGISWIWMGLEGDDSQYTKLHEMDAHDLIGDLQSHGIRILGSSIIGMEDHTVDNMDEAIDFAVQYDTDFHQFMLYTPIPGTPLHADLSAAGRMKDTSEFEHVDIHGQYIFNYRHSHIPAGEETELLRRAFVRDFEVNGPSVVRIVRTTLAGWKQHKNHPDARVRRRYQWEARELSTTFSALVGAAKRYYRKNPEMYAKMSAVLDDLHAEYGFKSRFYSFVGGLWLLGKIRKEEKRLAAGWTCEPETFYEKNLQAKAFDGSDVDLAISVASRITPAVADQPEKERGRINIQPSSKESPISK